MKRECYTTINKFSNFIMTNIDMIYNFNNIEPHNYKLGVSSLEF